MTRPFRRALWGIIGGLLFTVSLIWVNRTSLAQAIGDFLVVHDDLQPVDLIHVLGGNPNRGKYAAQLYEKGYAPRLFFSGETPKDGRPVNPDYISQSQAIALGVDPQAIVPFTSTATSTYDEAVELKQILTKNPDIQSVIIVSDPFHMRRASWTFHRIIGKQAQLFFVPIPASMAPDLSHWWTTKSTRQTVSREYTKLLYYMLVYLW
ncbi:MAG: YdcF family protein [Anaerolineae bacterium]|nr:YdcF family protein [Anaerolineae bacterium]